MFDNIMDALKRSRNQDGEEGAADGSEGAAGAADGAEEAWSPLSEMSNPQGGAEMEDIVQEQKLPSQKLSPLWELNKKLVESLELHKSPGQPTTSHDDLTASQHSDTQGRTWPEASAAAWPPAAGIDPAEPEQGPEQQPEEWQYEEDEDEWNQGPEQKWAQGPEQPKQQDEDEWEDEWEDEPKQQDEVEWNQGHQGPEQPKRHDDDEWEYEWNQGHQYPEKWQRQDGWNQGHQGPEEGNQEQKWGQGKWGSDTEQRYSQWRYQEQFAKGKGKGKDTEQWCWNQEQCYSQPWYQGTGKDTEQCYSQPWYHEQCYSQPFYQEQFAKGKGKGKGKGKVSKDTAEEQEAGAVYLGDHLLVKDWSASVDEYPRAHFSEAWDENELWLFEQVGHILTRHEYVQFKLGLINGDPNAWGYVQSKIRFGDNPDVVAADYLCNGLDAVMEAALAKQGRYPPGQEGDKGGGDGGGGGGGDGGGDGGGAPAPKRQRQRRGGENAWWHTGKYHAEKRGPEALQQWLAEHPHPKGYAFPDHQP